MQRTNLQIAVDAFEDALIRGICREGALEVALGAAEGVNLESLLRELEKDVKRSKVESNHPRQKCP
jgi:hypothetical protein